MKTVIKHVSVIVFHTLLGSAPAAGLDPLAWRFEQQVVVSVPGLTKLDLPVETIAVSQSGLEDVRLLSPRGVETPLVIWTSPQESPRSQLVKDFQTRAAGSETILMLETGATDAIDAVILQTPAQDFIKSVRVEAGSGGEQWQELVKGDVIFRQRDGAGRLKVSIPSAVYPRLRITVDDLRATPVPFTGAALDFTALNRVTIPHNVIITQVEEKRNQTVLTLDLGAANLNIARLSILVSDPVFSRRVTLNYLRDDHGVPRMWGGTGTVLCRLPEKEGLTAESLDLPVDSQIPVKQATLTILNGDSPPLRVTGVSATRQPVSLVFFATETGQWKLLTGQRTAARPSYDLSALEGELRKSQAGAATAGPLLPNLSYQEPQALPAIPVDGAGINLAAWRFRKPVPGAAPGIIRMELDEEVLANCQSELADLRLVQNGRQIPWVQSPSKASRIIQPTVSPSNDPKRPSVSVWKLTQPHAGLPVRSLTCSSPTPLFDRSFILWGNRKDELGNIRRIQYGAAQWKRQSADQTLDFSLQLPSIRLPEELFLEANNGDNPPIAISGVKFLSAVQIVVAKLTEDEPVFLYYGNETATAPNYDLQLVREELLAATPALATLGAGEVLRARSSGVEVSAGSPWLWIALGVVVAVLLWIVARMLPAAAGKSPA